MLKSMGLLFGLVLLMIGTFSCQPASNGSKRINDPETEKLQREVDSLRRVKEALQDELNTVNGVDEPNPEPPVPVNPSNAADGPLDGLSVLSAKKQFNADFKPILRVTFRNYAEKRVVEATIAVDFSFNSNELSPNCHFEKKIKVNLAPDANQTLNIDIPEGYDKNCADKAWVVVREVVFSDGSKK